MIQNLGLFPIGVLINKQAVSEKLASYLSISDMYTNYWFVHESTETHIYDRNIFLVDTHHTVCEIIIIMLVKESSIFNMRAI